MHGDGTIKKDYRENCSQILDRELLKIEILIVDYMNLMFSICTIK